MAGQLEGFYRGCLVSYKDTVYYYQPNGSSCYLYNTRDVIGDTSKAVVEVGRGSVRKATKAEVEEFVSTLPPPRPYIKTAVHPHIPFTEYELAYHKRQKKEKLRKLLKDKVDEQFELLYNKLESKEALPDFSDDFVISISYKKITDSLYVED
jgi:hypothetical protein